MKFVAALTLLFSSAAAFTPASNKAPVNSVLKARVISWNQIDETALL
jgi:hypothetical protein